MLSRLELACIKIATVVIVTVAVFMLLPCALVALLVAVFRRLTGVTPIAHEPCLDCQSVWEPRIAYGTGLDPNRPLA